MKTAHLKWFLCLALVLACTDSVLAQKKVTKPKARPKAPVSAYNTTQAQSNTKSAYSNQGTDTTKPGGSAYLNNNTNSKLNIDTSLPITVIKGSGNGLLDNIKYTQRDDMAVDPNFSGQMGNDSFSLPYENIREDDAVYRVRVWREIDAREKQNLPFRYAAEENNGNQRFISILLRAIQDNKLTAFSGDDDRFTTPITADAAMNAFGSGFDTSAKLDRDGNTVGYEVRAKAIEPDSIYKFQVKEEWIFDKESSRLFVRILGIAPVIPYRLSTGEIIPNSYRPIWWVYYPDARPILANAKVYNPKNFGARMSWEDLFEARMFSSYIVKSTFDNPGDQPLSALYPNNTMYRLLEGEKIKEKIFNYEQNLWAY